MKYLFLKILQSVLPPTIKKHFKPTFSLQVLTDPQGSTFEWAYSNGTDIPAGTVQGGSTANNEPLFIGRVSHNGAMCSGKVRPSDGILYIPYGGIEHQYEIFEYLVRRETL